MAVEHKEEKIEKELYGLHYTLKDIYDFSDEIDDYYNPRLEKFKGIHSKQRCFIVATGPSLRMNDLDVLKKNMEICISMNRIYKAFEYTEWRPEYYVAEDKEMCSNYKNEMLSLDVKCKFLSDSFLDIWKDNSDPSFYKYHSCLSLFLPQLPKLSENIARKIYWSGIVTYVCLQLAIYMGFKEIYLLGVDFNYRGNGGNYFYEKEFEEGSRLVITSSEESLAGYKKAKEYADTNNIKNYNATRNGKLEVFERIEFDKIFI